MGARKPVHSRPIGPESVGYLRECLGGGDGVHSHYFIEVLHVVEQVAAGKTKYELLRYSGLRV